jgi:hypothetical protein
MPARQRGLSGLTVDVVFQDSHVVFGLCYNLKKGKGSN